MPRTRLRQKDRNLKLILDNDILPSLLLPAFARLRSRILFTQLWENERADCFDDAWEDGRAEVEEPAVGVGGIVEVDAAFEDGVLCYAEVAADWGH